MNYGWAKHKIVNFKAFEEYGNGSIYDVDTDKHFIKHHFPTK